MTHRIKCRFCDWSTPKWTTNKKGQHIEGYGKLLRHIEFNHPEKLEELWTQEKDVLSESQRLTLNN